MEDDNLGIIWVIAVFVNLLAWSNALDTGNFLAITLALIGTICLIPLTMIVGIIALAELSVQKNY